MYRFDDPLSEDEAQNCGNRDEKPSEPENEAGDEDGGAPEVLGAAAQRVDFRPDAVDDGLDGGAHLGDAARVQVRGGLVQEQYVGVPVDEFAETDLGLLASA